MKKNIVLNSYKIDTSVLLNKLDQLNGLKSELEVTISKCKEQKSTIDEEIDIFKSQNQVLKKRIIELVQLNSKQEDLIQDLKLNAQSLKRQCQQYKEMYESQLINKQKACNYYQRKVEMFQKDKNQLIKIYESKIDHLSKIQPQMISKMKQNSLFQTFQKQNQQKEYEKQNIQIEVVNQGGKRISGFHKNSGRMSSDVSSILITSKNKMKTTPIIYKDISQKSFKSGEDLYLQMIRSIYKKLSRSNLKTVDFVGFDVVKKFAENHNPVKQDYCFLLLQYPFQIGSPSQASLQFEFISNQLSRKRLKFTGKNIVHEIVAGVSQMEAIHINNTQQISQSQNFSTKMINNYASEAPLGKTPFTYNRRSKDNDIKSTLNNIKRVSIAQSLQSDSLLNQF